MFDTVISPLDVHVVSSHVVSIDAGAWNICHSSTGPLTTGTASLHDAAGQAPTSQLVWTQHPLAGFDSQYDGSSCWFEQDSNGLGEWHGCGRWESIAAPDGGSGGQWVQDAVPDWQEVPPDADGPILAHQKAALVSFVRQPGEESSRGSTFSISQTKSSFSKDDVSQDRVVSKASPSHLLLTAHACTLAALQVPTLMPRSKAPQVCVRTYLLLLGDGRRCYSLVFNEIVLVGPAFRRWARAAWRVSVRMQLTMPLQ